jgi:hypothetical protein
MNIENQINVNPTEELEFGKFNSELQNELLEFKKEAEIKIASMLGAIEWFDTFDKKMDSVNERIRKIKGIKPNFVLSRENKDKIEELTKAKGELEKMKKSLLASDKLGSEGLLGHQMIKN